MSRYYILNSDYESVRGLVETINGLLCLIFREVHSVCSWDEKASSKIQKALEQEILAFIGDAQKVSE